MIQATLYNDPACPWGYSASPALHVLAWRYGDQLNWKLTMIGLTEDASQYVARGFTPLRGALGQLHFRRYGMPFSPAPKSKISATARGCRAIVAARLASPGQRVEGVPGAAAGQLHHPARARGRRPARGCARLRSRHRRPADHRQPRFARGHRGLRGRPGASRARRRARRPSCRARRRPAMAPSAITAPSVVFQANGTTLIAGGFQPVEAYDVLIANLDPDAAARAGTGHAGAAARALPHRAHHPGGRGADGRGQRSTGSPGRRSGADRAGCQRPRRPRAARRRCPLASGGDGRRRRRIVGRGARSLARARG